MNRLFTGAAASALLAMAAPAAAQAPAPSAEIAARVRTFAVPAGPLEEALPLFARQGDVQVFFPTTLAAGRRTAGLTGDHGPEDGLTLLLRGTGLGWRQTRPGLFTITPPESVTPRLAETVEDVIVTGSLLRGVGDGPSPVVSLTRDDIDRSGHATVAQALQALPQNFAGTANEATRGNGGDRTASNSSIATGLNLRGLGSDATLVLVNGRRLAGTGVKGDFADISTLPTAAVRRVDVLLDGASALYGADAVGGVVNIILRDDYEGAESRVRIGAARDGAEELLLAQTIGRRWDTGHVLATWEYFDRAALSAADRRLAGDADLRWRGGSDRRLIFSNPGNIVTFDSALGGYTPAFAIPAGQDGTALAPSDFITGGVNRSNQREGLDVLPHQRRHSAYLALGQDIGRLELSADLRYGRRDYDTVSAAAATTFTVTSANPWFVSPTGASSHTLAYSFGEDIGGLRTEGEAESIGASVGADLALAGDWRMSAYGAWASDRFDNLASNQINTTHLREALGALPDNPATAYSAGRDGYFNPFGDGSNSSQAALDFISAGFSSGRGETTIATANLQIDGTLVTLPGGPLRLALGANVREETYERQATNFTSGLTPTVGAVVHAERLVSAAFAELRIPVIGPDNARPGFRRLDLSAAARFEDYDDFGQKLSPKTGIRWSPFEGVVVRASRGQSYRAPALREINDAPSASPTYLPRGGQQILSMILYGGNPELEPESAETLTWGVEYSPASIEGLSLGFTRFRTDFDNRIGQPAFENILVALTDPALAPFARPIDPGASEADRAEIQAILDLPTTGLADMFPAEAYGAIVDARYVNTASLLLEGVDLTARYSLETGGGTLSLDGSLTWLDRFDTRATPTSPVVSGVDRPNAPAALRWRTSAGWARGPWQASAALNHVGGYPDEAGGRIGSWTTVDGQIAWEPLAGPLAGLTVQLSARNLFDRDPPFYDAPQGVGYDPANTSVLGRSIALQITRRW